ncbi:MAG: bifunctional phosphoribosylaminoimidazolecarboxamide formyltransferase/IMP cyclohydrolase [Symploca sp. SIO2G7]|nr:bifunctional phosphoribosylaminoimidazolecarboxamide formyltransferase/IMP cyclohydrolase [Symploca sp. SIO2G7]
MTRLALLSATDKVGIVDLAKILTTEFDFDILSSGGTARTLTAAGIPVTKVSDYTGFPEILGGRVKTLQPRIHGGILARTNNPGDQKDLADNDIRPVDLVVVNLYPFEQTIAKSDTTLTDAIENIDIGGPTLLRSAAKNYAHVTVLCYPAQYAGYLSELRANGQPSLEFRADCARQVFWHTAAYDQAIATYLTQQGATSQRFVLSGSQKQPLRYGENPHQPAVWYQIGSQPSGWAAAKKLQGKDLSYNNLVDLEAARRMIAEFPSENGPAAAVLKHTNPCGVAIGQSLASAYRRAFEADSVSAFGGIVALNQAIDVETAKALTQTFLECVVAPGCVSEAREILATKKNLRVLVLTDWLSGPSQTIRAIAGGFLTQTADDFQEDVSQWKIVTERQPNAAELTEMLFAWRVAKHVKSNAIVVTNGNTTVGIGAGQMNRVGAAKLALEQAAAKAVGATLASDGFFPFDDSVRTAATAGIKSIVQPGGSIRDEDSIGAANALGLIMAFTGTRHFLH